MDKRKKKGNNKMKNTYAVFGLGRYGIAVAKELIRNGAEVLAVDINDDNVKIASLELPLCKCADVTNASVIEQLGISNIDVVVIAMANNLEASVMAITLCKEAGVKTVIAKCANKMHQKILKKIGADKVVFPESESGVRLAKNLLSSGFVDMVELSEDVAVLEIDVAKEWIGKTLIELNLRKKYSINIIAIKDKGHTSIEVDPNKPLESDMELVVITHIHKIQKLSKELKR